MPSDVRYLTLVHPGAEDVPVSYNLAPRLASLSGARIGLIDNRKRHSDVFLARLQEVMSERYGVESSRRLRAAFSKALSVNDCPDPQHLKIEGLVQD